MAVTRKVGVTGTLVLVASALTLASGVQPAAAAPRAGHPHHAAKVEHCSPRWRCQGGWFSFVRVLTDDLFAIPGQATGPNAHHPRIVLPSGHHSAKPLGLAQAATVKLGRAAAPTAPARAPASGTAVATTVPASRAAAAVGSTTPASGPVVTNSDTGSSQVALGSSPGGTTPARPATSAVGRRAAATRAAARSISDEPVALATGPWQGLSVQAATKLSIPIYFGAAVMLFILLQALVDRRDPKLSRAPERGEDDTVGFE